MDGLFEKLFFAPELLSPGTKPNSNVEPNFDSDLLEWATSLVIYQEGGGAPFDLIQKKFITPGGDAGWTENAKGVAGDASVVGSYWEVDADADDLLGTDDGTTLAFIRRKITGGTTDGSVFATTSSTSSRCQSHCPFLDGTVYWDYGGTSGNNRLTAPGLTHTGIQTWTFTAGAAGMAIYLEGIREAYNASAVTRSSSSGPFWINGQTGFFGVDPQEFNIFLICRRQWSDEQAARFAEDPWQVVKPVDASVIPAIANVSSAVTGTATASIVEADIVAGGKTIILTLANDTWVTAGATFDAQRQNIINGMNSAQSEGTGWNVEVRGKEVVGAVVRTSDTVVTVTLSVSASYDITARETITVTVPATALVIATGDIT